MHMRNNEFIDVDRYHRHDYNCDAYNIYNDYHRHNYFL